MSTVTYKYTISWVAGDTTNHNTSDCPTIDAVANSMFGQPSADLVQSQFGNTITAVRSQAASETESAEAPSVAAPSETTVAHNPHSHAGEEHGLETKPQGSAKSQSHKK